MKEWVKWFLVEENVKQYKDKNEGQEAIAEICEDLEDEEEVYDQLIDYFNVDFGRDELNGPSDYISNAFGSVLADLPENVFKELSEMKNLFFTFTPHAGAEVKRFVLADDFRTGEKIQIVTFPYTTAFLPLSATRGEIAHQLAHIYGEHNGASGARTDATQRQADQTAKFWGFQEEIRAHRDYLTAKERSWGLKEKLRAYRAAHMSPAETDEKRDKPDEPNEEYDQARD